MDEDKLKEDATQVSNVNAGKTSIFGSKNPNEENWYKQLFELDDYMSDDKYDCYDEDIDEDNDIDDDED